MASAQFTRPGYPAKKRSLLFDQDLSPEETNLRNQRLDLGLDPDNPNTALVGSAGLSTAFNRNTNRLLEGFKLGGNGTRQLTANETSDAAALRNGSGSVYNEPNDPRNFTRTAKFYADSVMPTRARGNGLPGEEFVPQSDIFDQQYKDDMAVNAAKINAENRARRAALIAKGQIANARATGAQSMDVWAKSQGLPTSGGKATRPVTPVSLGDTFATDHNMGDPATYIAPGPVAPAVRGVTPIDGAAAPVQRAVVNPDVLNHDEPGDVWTARSSKNMSILNPPAPAPSMMDRVRDAYTAPFRKASDFVKRQVNFLDEKTKDWPERKPWKFGL